MERKTTTQKLISYTQCTKVQESLLKQRQKNTKQFNIQPGDTLHGGCITIDAILFNAVCNKPALFQNENKMLKKSLSWQIG